MHRGGEDGHGARFLRGLRYHGPHICSHVLAGSLKPEWGVGVFWGEAHSVKLSQKARRRIGDEGSPGSIRELPSD